MCASALTVSASPYTFVKKLFRYPKTIAVDEREIGCERKDPSARELRHAPALRCALALAMAPNFVYP